MDGNARAAAMGGAQGALARGSAALHYNPAGLAFSPYHEAGFMHNQYFQGMTQDHLAVSSRRGWGAFLNNFDFGSVERTTLSNKDATLGQVGGSDLAFGGGLAFSPLKPVALGAVMKFMRSTLDSIDTKVLAFDFGGLYLPPLPGLAVGLSAHNLRAETRFEKDKKKLPTYFRGGAAYALQRGRLRANFTADYTHRPNQNFIVGLGAEFILGKVMPVRFGYTNRSGTGEGLTAGLGWIQGNYRFDYAVVPFGDLGLTHRAGLTIRWGADPPKTEPPPAPGPPAMPDLPGLTPRPKTLK